jgi:hypothetical protein
MTAPWKNKLRNFWAQSWIPILVSSFGCHKVELVILTIVAPGKQAMYTKVEELLGAVLEAEDIVALTSLMCKPVTAPNGKKYLQDMASRGAGHGATHRMTHLKQSHERLSSLCPCPLPPTTRSSTSCASTLCLSHHPH